MADEERNPYLPEGNSSPQDTPPSEEGVPNKTPETNLGPEQPYVQGPIGTPPTGAQAFETSTPETGPAPIRPIAGVSGVSDDDRLMAALAWLSMVVLQIPLVSVVLLIAEGNKNRPFQRYHAIASILFWAVAFVYEILAGIAFTILTIVSFGLLAICLWVIFFLPHLAALYYTFRAYQGHEVEIPFVSEFARQQRWI